MVLYAVTIFLSAFLLFQVQPLIAKIILPWFGGSAAVWAASLLFFQLLLLAGYAYAHVLIRFLAAKKQMMVHVGLLLASCALLPILPSQSWRPTDAGDPLARILLLLTATIGLPYFLLSSTSPLLQAWFVRRTGSEVPYRLFALSNFGSMLALVTFPFLVEPQLTTKQQAYSWSTAYVAFALLCAFTAWVSKDVSKEARSSASETKSVEPVTESFVDAAATPTRPGFGQLILWILLATCASVLLVSVTNHMSQNVAPIPLLWVAPLALYLLTFILAFESDRAYQRWLFIPLLILSLGGMAYMIYADEGNFNIKWAIPGFSLGLFVACMVCHGEMARRRPAPQFLTLFYLMVSVGGALGGVFVALVAPRVFSGLWELPVGLVSGGILALIATWSVKPPEMGLWPSRLVAAFGTIITASALIVFFARKEYTGRLEVTVGAVALGICVLGIGFAARWASMGMWLVRAVLFVGTIAMAGYLFQHERTLSKDLKVQARNFYGMLEVRDDPPTQDYAERTLLHGTINHGSQLLDPVLRYVTTSYYGKRSGVGRALTALQTKGPVRYGVVGLGTGVLTNYSRKGDYLRVYEINPLVEKLAQTQFTFFPHSQADKKIVMGDARLVLEQQLKKEGPQNFDLLAVDAFSSDAIPVHLLTKEAVGLYFQHLKPNGVLALHISNRYLELQPVCERDAATFGKQARTVEDEGEQAPYFSSSTWVLLTADGEFFNDPAFKDAYMYPPVTRKNFRGWTDDYSNLFQILNVK
jgi:hypothetical protein